MAQKEGAWRMEGPMQGRKRPQEGPEDDLMKRRRMDDPVCPPATLRVLVRNSDAGGIIGKGGDNIKRLRKLVPVTFDLCSLTTCTPSSQYDCQVLLPDSAGSPERVMTIMGTIDSCCGVIGEVLPKIGEESHRGEPNFTTEVQVLIPQPFMGTIIGTGGTKIKELRMHSKAAIKIFSEPMPNSNERSISLQGTSDQILHCVQYFLEEISKKEPREPIYLYEPGGQYPSYDGPSQHGGHPPFMGGRGRGGGREGWNSRGRRTGGGGGGGGGWSSRGPTANSTQPRTSPPSAWTPPPSQTHSYPPTNSTPPSHPPPSQPPPSQQHFSVPSTPPVGYGSAQVSQSPSTGYSMPPPQTSGPPPSLPPLSSQQPQPSYSQQAPPQPLQQRQTQQVTIPIGYSEAILGPGGTRLQSIMSQSGCEITMDEPKHTSHERIITILGPPSAIQFAQQLMQSSVRQHHHM